MKKIGILPGAAGIIALTATIGFVDGQCDVEAESFTRGRVTSVKAPESIEAVDALSQNPLNSETGRSVYLVSVSRNNQLSEVKVDAATGQVLLVKAIL